MQKRELPEVLDAAIGAALANVHTGLPAKVVKFDAEKNTADVELVTKAEYVDPETRARVFEERSLIGDVPVIWPRGGGYCITLPLYAGDFVWLMFSEQALGEWRQTGETAEPLDARRHSIGYPYAMPGAYPDVQRLASSDDAARASKMILGADGEDCQIVIDQDHVPAPEIKLGRNATDFVALAPLVKAALDLIKGHKHASFGTVSADLTTMATDVAATMVKAK